MGTKLVICLFLATHLHADDITFTSSAAPIEAPTTPQNMTAETTTPELFDIDAELAKISCMSSRDHEQLWGGLLKHGLARWLSTTMIQETVAVIGQIELRKALGFSPPHPWRPHNYTKPSEEELASAPTAEAYFDLKEPRKKNLSLDSLYFFEHNFPPAVAFLDKRYPSIRTVFRRRFEEMRRFDAGVTDRKAIDRMIVEFLAFHNKVVRATEKMFEIDCYLE